MIRRSVIVIALGLLGIGAGVLAQQPNQDKGKAKAKQAKATRPPLFFREEWKQGAASGEHGVMQDSVANPNLELKLYGPQSKEMQVTGAPGDENNPMHLWTGLCPSACAAALREKNNYADLTGLARLHWITKMSGFHAVRPIVKLADGTWLVGDHADGSIIDWMQSEIFFSDLRWLHLDIERVVTTGTWVEHPDLSKVDEIGFADLMPSSGHGAGGWADVALFEVYGKPVKR